jgi:hypothetical protein
MEDTVMLAMEVLCVYLCTVQQDQGWENEFVINPMHIGLDVACNPKHLLIVGPFMDEDLQIGQWMHEEISSKGYSPHLYVYNRLDDMT